MKFWNKFIKKQIQFHSVRCKVKCMRNGLVYGIQPITRWSPSVPEVIVAVNL